MSDNSQLLNIAGYATVTNVDICINNIDKLIYFDVSDCKIGINCTDTSYSLEVAKTSEPTHDYEGFIKTYGLMVDSSVNIHGNAIIENLDVSNLLNSNLLNTNSLTANYLDVSFSNITDCSINFLDVSTAIMNDVSITNLEVINPMNNLNLNILDVSNITVNESALFKSDISLDGGYIYYSSGTLPENTGNILATKQYVDEFIQGIHVKKSVEFATISGENLLFDNIDNNQLTINLSTGYLDSCNNPDIYIVNNRVLVKNQTDETQNGVYYILENASSNLTLERTQDLSAGSKSQGVYVFIDGSNSSQQNTSWIQTNDVSNVIIGDNSLNFVQFSRAGDYRGSKNILITDLKIELKSDISINSIISNKGIFSDVSINNLEIINSLVVNDACHGTLTAGDASINNLDVSNLVVLNSLIVKDASHGTLKAYDASINYLEIINSLVVNDACHGTLTAGDASINTLDVSNLVVLNSLIVKDASHGTFIAHDASINYLEIINSLVVDDACHGTLTAEDASINNLDVSNLVVLNSLIVEDASHGTLIAYDASINYLEIINSLVVDDACHGTLKAEDASINNLDVSNLVVLNSLIVKDASHGTLIAHDASINYLEIINSLVVHDACHGTLTAGDASINNLDVSNLVVFNSLIVKDACHGTFRAHDASINYLDVTDTLVVENIYVQNSRHSSARFFEIDASKVVINGDFTSTINQVDFSNGNIILPHKDLQYVPSDVIDRAVVSKYYVDQIAQGINVKDNVNYATIPLTYIGEDSSETLLFLDNAIYTNISTSGLLFSPKYANIDGIYDIDHFNKDDSVLINSQLNAKHNGIYTFSIPNIHDGEGTFNFHDNHICYHDASKNWFLERRYDLSYDEIVKGIYVFVTDGNTNKNTSWLQSSNLSSVKIGDNSLNFALFSKINEYKSGQNINIDSFLNVNLINDICINNIFSETGNILTLDVSGLITKDITVNNNLTVANEVTIVGTISVDGHSQLDDASINYLDVGGLNVFQSIIGLSNTIDNQSITFATIDLSATNIDVSNIIITRDVSVNNNATINSALINDASINYLDISGLNIFQSIIDLSNTVSNNSSKLQTSDLSAGIVDVSNIIITRDISVNNNANINFGNINEITTSNIGIAQSITDDYALKIHSNGNEVTASTGTIVLDVSSSSETSNSSSILFKSGVNQHDDYAYIQYYDNHSNDPPDSSGEYKLKIGVMNVSGSDYFSDSIELNTNGIELNTNGITSIFCKYDGKVGIGKISPEHLLDVSGMTNTQDIIVNRLAELHTVTISEILTVSGINIYSYITDLSTSLYLDIGDLSTNVYLDISDLSINVYSDISDLSINVYSDISDLSFNVYEKITMDISDLSINVYSDISDLSINVYSGISDLSFNIHDLSFNVYEKITMDISDLSLNVYSKIHDLSNYVDSHSENFVSNKGEFVDICANLIDVSNIIFRKDISVNNHAFINDASINSLDLSGINSVYTYLTDLSNNIDSNYQLIQNISGVESTLETLLTFKTTVSDLSGNINDILTDICNETLIPLNENISISGTSLARYIGLNQDISITGISCDTIECNTIDISNSFSYDSSSTAINDISNHSTNVLNLKQSADLITLIYNNPTIIEFI